MVAVEAEHIFNIGTVRHVRYVEGPGGRHHLRVGNLEIGQNALMLSASVILGLAAGYSSLAFRALIALEHHMAFDWLAPHARAVFGAAGIIVPLVCGGALTAFIIHHFAVEAKGHGVPAVLAALRLRGGIIRPRVILVKTLTAATCIGFGGSCGREGPIVLIGSTWGSVIGQLLAFPTPMMRTLVASGAAAGIAATFNAPIGGVIFASEVILRDFAPRSFVGIAVASVVATLVARSHLGNHPALNASAYALISPAELILYALLGAVAAVWASAFMRLLHFLEHRFDKLVLPVVVKAMIGFGLVGVIGIWFPQVLGLGYENVQNMLDNHLSPLSAFVLALLKPLATTLTLGSGGSGGLLAPMLITGGMLGDGFGSVVHALFPAWTGVAAAYGLVGMAAMFSAANEAPITAIAIVFEITGDYTLILPLMIGSVIAALLGRSILSRKADTIATLERPTVEKYAPPA
jgi:chloride channel protein, CIC family